MSESKQSKVYKASAGSGKTFRLAVEYLKIVLVRPDAFQNILAVTFTNKATKEMKERIVGVLEGLARGAREAEGYLAVLTNELESEVEGIKWSREEIARRASQALTQILHGYSKFKIQTIDSFFQSIFRGLLKELAIGNMPNLELDNSQTIEQAIEGLYMKMDEDEELMGWMNRYVAEKIEEGKSLNLDREMKEMGIEIAKETFQSAETEEEARRVPGLDKLTTIKDDARERKRAVVDAVQDCVKAFRAHCDRDNMAADDFCSVVLTYFNNLEKNSGDYGKKDFMTKSARDGMEGLKSVLKAGAVKKGHSEDRIRTFMRDAEEARNTTEFNTADLILRNMKLIGLASEMQEEMRRVNDAEGRFALSDTNSFLRKIIDKDTAPFIYERIGTMVDHIMIDEFQDTSRMQWENFHALLEETQSRGGLNLIVGDPKQAIYRWRNGDWRIIEELGGDGALRMREVNMEDNFRSSWRVINFNNAVFRSSLRFLPKEPKGLCESIANIYGGAMQNCKKKDRGGYVEVKFFSAEKEEEEGVEEKMMRRMGDTMLRLRRENGIPYEKMAVITRKNGQIVKVAHFFATHEEYKELSIVSDEAFKLASSDMVCAIVGALRYVLEYVNESVREVVSEEGEGRQMQGVSATVAVLAVAYQRLRNQKEAREVVSNVSFARDAELVELLSNLRGLVGLPLYEMVESICYFLTRGEEGAVRECDPFVQVFMDSVQGFIGSHGGDLYLFLKHWDERLCDKSVQMGDEGVSGIRAMTIHKSKGLEFDTLFVPFADWNTVNSSYFIAPNIWCDYNGDLLPIRFSGAMGDSEFAKEYNEEVAQQWVDNVNVLYVALTRAQNNLFVYSKKCKDNKQGETHICSVAEIIYDAIMDADCEETDADSAETRAMKKEMGELKREMATEVGWFPDEDELRIGELPQMAAEDDAKTQKEEKKEETVTKLNAPSEPVALVAGSYRLKGKFRQSNRSRAFVRNPEDFAESDADEEKKGINEYISRGKMLHAVFSRIKSKKDVERAVREAYYEGVIESAEDAESIVAFIKEKIERDAPKEWFAEGAKLMNEREITVREDGVLVRKRPDRVIINSDEVIVVDFKFGKAANVYAEQVRGYVELLKSMGYGSVRGYLWYVYDGEIVEV